MEHKIIIAQNLREGLSKIKAAYQLAFYQGSAFKEQWQLFVMKETMDIDCFHHSTLIDQNFAWRSKQLLCRIRGD